MPYVGKKIPNGFIECKGQKVSKKRYSKLFSVIENSHGDATDNTKFNVPNLQPHLLRETVYKWETVNSVKYCIKT